MFTTPPPESDIIITLFELVRKLDINQVKLFALKYYIKSLECQFSIFSITQ